MPFPYDYLPKNIEELLKSSEEFKFDLESKPRLSESINLLRTKSFDIILLDLALPDSDRESTLERVLSVTNAIPIVILTGIGPWATVSNLMKLNSSERVYLHMLGEAVFIIILKTNYIRGLF